MQNFGNWDGGSNTPYKQGAVKFDASQYEFFGKNVMEHELGESYDETEKSNKNISVPGNAKGKYAVSSSSADELATTFNQLNMINEPRNSRRAVRRERVFGTVKWYSNERGYGFLTSTDTVEDVFVHSSSLKTDGCIHLTSGTSVEFEVLSGWDRRVQAINVTAPGGRLLKDTRRADHGGDAVRSVDGGGSAWTGAVNTSQEVGPCFRCGEWGHLARDCSHLGAEDGPVRAMARPSYIMCYQCGNGHLVVHCPYGRIQK